MNLVYFKCM